MKKINFAIMGAGNIAKFMAETVKKMDTVEAYAVASRDINRAKSLADEYGFSKSYGSYQEMINDPNVDLVYIATPHSHHAQHILQCLEGGKHVLCEKAFTVTADEAKNVLNIAKNKKLLVTEAIWPRYMPMAKTLQEFCASGKIGKIQSLTCNLGYPVSHIERIKDPVLAGGALLDVGVYTLTFASIVMGDDIKDITTTAIMNDLGVDIQSTITLTYKDNRMASLFCSVLVPTDRMGIIYGEKGYAIVDNINNFETLRVFNANHELLEQINRPQQITGYEYEVQAAVDAINAGEIECSDMPHKETVLIMELMDRIRHSWNMWYPGEKKS
jgi:predicted dehydrogenase